MRNNARKIAEHTEMAKDIYNILNNSPAPLTVYEIEQKLHNKIAENPPKYYCSGDINPIVIGLLLSGCTGFIPEMYGMPEMPFKKSSSRDCTTFEMPYRIEFKPNGDFKEIVRTDHNIKYAMFTSATYTVK